jgi:hypothetical protein
MSNFRKKGGLSVKVKHQTSQSEELNCPRHFFLGIAGTFETCDGMGGD